MVRLEAPTKFVEMVSVALLTVMVDAAAIVSEVPPETTIAPDPDAKIIVPKAWPDPETDTVPAARPVAPLPKLTSSVVAVGEVKAGAGLPVPLVFQLVLVPHVPPAVPKPAVTPLLSQ